jgi:sugar/nucleoside kinase (ribokinase family)
MPNSNKKPLDYICIGHLTKDMGENGAEAGGTAAFSALTAKEFGFWTAILTAGSPPDIKHIFEGIEIHCKSSNPTTTFMNIETGSGRKQHISEVADYLQSTDIPASFSGFSGILHLGPVANEVDPEIIKRFPNAFIGVTPQGWMRQWDNKGLVSYKLWKPDSCFLENVDAAVFSIEDVAADEEIVSDFSQKLKIMAVTEGIDGARIYWRGDVRRIQAPAVSIIDPTGAGDIFAAVFFIRLHQGCDPWEAGRQAVQLASLSVARQRLKSIPTKREIQTTMVEIF